MKVVHVVGARPNYMKVAPLMREMAKRPDRWEQILIHTGQHYDHQMSRVFFEDLGLPDPDVYLGVGSGSHAQQYARVMQAFEPVLERVRPDWVLVVGDVNSTLACALCSAQMGIRVAHVEAGLRSCDRSMPEEINRTLTDHLSELLFITEPSGNTNLQREGISARRIRFVGNVMIDTLVHMLPRARDRKILRDLGLVAQSDDMAGLEIGKQEPRYVLVTLHRPSNVDSVSVLKEILSAIEVLSHDLPVIFPVHPRTRKQIEEIHHELKSRQLRLLEPLGYLDFLALMCRAALVITDSGGIQEETTYLDIPCLTVRPNTERPITLEMGNNRLVRGDRGAILEATHAALNGSPFSAKRRPALWDGRAAERIVSELEKTALVATAG